MTAIPQDPARIAASVGGSAHSAAALQWAIRQAMLTGARIDAVARWHRPVFAGYAPMVYGDLGLAQATGDATRAAIADAVAATPGGS